MRPPILRAPRKLPHPRKGIKRSGMLRLKHLKREVRQKLYALTDKMTGAAWREHLLQTHRIRLSSDAQVTRFRDWHWNQERLENRNDRVEQFEAYFKDRTPQATAEEIRSAAIAFMLHEAAMEGDRKGFNSIARTSITDDAERRARAEFEWDAAEQCLKHLPALREIAADGKLDENAKIEEARKRLFGSTP